jgi:AcrR family transcriptional regulator
METRFHPPRQSRSQETLHRILDAAERVLAEKSFEEATLAEIMERAGVTVGAFYRRFPDKNALIHHIDERFFTELYARASEVLDEERWRGQSLRRVIEGFALAAVTVYRTRRGVLRSLFLRMRTDPVILATAQRANEQFVSRLCALASERHDEVGHPDPDLAVPLGYTIFLGALRETTVFAEAWPAASALSDEALAAELARTFSGYLALAAES